GVSKGPCERSLGIKNAPWRCQAGRRDIMRLNCRAVGLIAVAVASLAPTATAVAASGSSLQGTARAAKGCITVTATIPVGRAPEGVAADSKAKAIYGAALGANPVAVVSGRPHPLHPIHPPAPAAASGTERTP